MVGVGNSSYLYCGKLHYTVRDNAIITGQSLQLTVLVVQERTDDDTATEEDSTWKERERN